jgi:F-type H+-transporting ATPase subunit alpha
MNVGISVSRVGSSAQIRAMRTATGSLKSDLAQYREMAAFAKFGSDLDVATQRLLARGARLTELLKQTQYSPQQAEEQVCVIYAGTRGYLDGVAVADIGRFESELLARLHSQHADLLEAIRTQKTLNDELEGRLKAVLDGFVATFA